MKAIMTYLKPRYLSEKRLKKKNGPLPQITYDIRLFTKMVESILILMWKLSEILMIF